MPDRERTDKRTDKGGDAIASLEEQLAAREQEIERLQKEFSAERAYLQAQLDTANAMWGFYANEGKPPALRSSSVSGTSDEHSDLNNPCSKENATPGDSERGKAGERGKLEVRGLAQYAIELEAKYQELLGSRSWRLTGPVRVLLRNAPRLMFRPPRKSNQWPKRPKLLREAASRRGEGSQALSERIESLSARQVRRHRSELERYSLILEKRIRAVFGAATWKAMGPLRESVRIYRRVVKGQAVRRGRLPRRPAGFGEKE